MDAPPSPHSVVPPLWPRLLGRSVRRSEDPPLLTGRGRYTADLALPGMLHFAVVRSPVADARVAVDVEEARRAPGVRLVWTAKDVRAALRRARVGARHRGAGGVQPLLADGVVRHVGEAVAVVAADDAYAAEDAAALVGLELDSLPAVLDPERALAGGPLANETLESNLVYDRRRVFGDPDRALSRGRRSRRRRRATRTSRSGRSGSAPPPDRSSAA